VIYSIRIRNYKGFRDSGHANLSAGLNLIVGRNNAGKTALIEALSLRFPRLPHRSLKTMPTRATSINRTSNVAVRFTLSRHEFAQIARERFHTFFVPARSNHKVQSEAERFGFQSHART